MTVTYSTKDGELTRFFSHIHQENYKLLVFCGKNPRPYLYSSSSPNGPNDISNIIYFSFWWHCWREDCSRYLHSRLCSQVNVLGEGYRPATVRIVNSVTISSVTKSDGDEGGWKWFLSYKITIKWESKWVVLITGFTDC